MTEAKAASWRPKKLAAEPRRKKFKQQETEVEEDDMGEKAEDKVVAGSSSSRPSKPGGKPKEQAEETGATKPAQTRRGGRRNRRKKHEEKVTVRDTGLKMFLVALAKLSLQTACRVRLVWGGVPDVAIGPEDHSVARAIASEGETFSEHIEAIHTELAEAKKKNEDTDEILERLRNQVSPAKSNYLGMVGALVSTPASGGMHVTIMKKWVDDHVDCPPAVQTCKLASVRQSGQVMIILGHRDVEIRATVNNALVQCGCRLKIDVPPPSGLEDDVSAWLAQLDK